MIEYPAMLMVGASGKDAGKTELACLLIRAFSPFLAIVGLKVSTLRDDFAGPAHQAYPTPSESSAAPYLLAEEPAPGPGTDTARMLASGARRSFLLRSDSSHLEQGFAAFRDRAGEAVIVCESNSLRKLVRPGLFLVIQKFGDDALKPSFVEMAGYADRVVHTDGSRFDFGPENVVFEQGKWSLRTDAGTNHRVSP